ncbi:hypothetical protein O181_077002 [Austropuccinia psidii MF-1]|uniref:Integrase catalytic domain-containing protein n=1 Tax=Austropuccinia psidii MF-1 TaxID=1389203 RepID=A0A9Q3FHX3_9BASI|nr:hypothetical protein [Austropuccinia psidii MF-1]
MNDQSSLCQNLPELTSSNYLQWKIQIQAYLMEMDLIDCITSNSEEISDASRQAEAVRRRRKTAGILIGTMGILNCQRFLAVVNEANPYNIWRTLSKHFTSNAEDNQARIFLEVLALKNEGSLEQFITDVTQHISKIASVGIMIGSPGDIKEALVVEIIVSKLNENFENTREILQSQRPLTISKVIEYLERRRQDLNDSVEMSLKNEQAFNAQSGKAKFKTTKKKKKDYPTCSNGRHNPKTKHTASQCCELQRLNNKTANQVLKNDSEDSLEECDPPTVHAAYNQPGNSHDIILDSGSSHHMTPHISVLQNYQSSNTFIHVANGESVKVEGKGFLHILSNDKITRIPCLHVPSLTTTLISLGKLCQLGYQFRILNCVNIQILNNNKIQMKLLHARAGHPSIEILRRMFKVTIPKIDCEACALSKSHRLPYSGVLPTAVKPLEFIHMDLSGRISPPTIGGAQYYFKITDQFTSFKYVFLLKNKSEAFHYFKKFCSIAFSLFRIYPINAIMDNGGEFVSSAFKAYFEKLGIQSHFTAPYTPQQNPVAERGNRTTSEKARSLLKHAHLPNQLWGEAVITAVFYENISPAN